jgi:hypothetical protein
VTSIIFTLKDQFVSQLVISKKQMWLYTALSSVDFDSNFNFILYGKYFKAQW